MMLFKERVVLEGLSPDLLRIEAFLEDLSLRRHNGYILFRGENNSIALFSYGKFLGCFDENGFTKKTEDVLARTNTIDVIALSDAVFSSFLCTLFGKKRYSGLRSEFVDIRKFLQDLEKEEFDGTIEVIGEKRGYMLMDEGVPQDSFLVVEEGLRRKDALSEIIQMSKGKSVINLYEIPHDNVRQAISLQKKTRFIFDRMNSLVGAGFHTYVERKLKEIKERYLLLQDISLSKEGMVRVPFVEERDFLKGEEIISSFDAFVQFLLSCVLDISGEATYRSLKEELERL